MLIGVICDDFTGSSDIANNLKKAGMSVGMYSGVPNIKIKLNKYNAVVIALKTRTISIKKAISIYFPSTVLYAFYIVLIDFNT